MLPSERSSGVATLDAIVSGLAPGRLALTTITGKSICGSGDTGSRPTARQRAQQHDRQDQQHGRDRALRLNQPVDPRQRTVHACGLLGTASSARVRTAPAPRRSKNR